MQKEKYILHLCSWYPSEEHPFNGDFIQRHIHYSGFQKQQIVFALCASSQKKAPTRIQVNKYITEIRWYYVHKNKFSLFKKIELYKKAYKSIINEFGIPVFIHVHVMYDAVYLANLFHKKSGIPFLVTEHNTVFNSNVKDLKSSLIRKFVYIYGKNAAMIFPVSNDLASSMRKSGFKQNSLVIPNIVTDAFLQPSKILQKNNSIPQFIHVSSLNNKTKNIEGLLRAFSKIPKDLKYRFLLIGNSNLKSTDNLIKQYKLETKVELKGPLSYEEVAKEMNNSDMFVLFSNHENLPCVLCEAAYIGLPVITTNAGGSAEIVQPSYMGEVIEIGNESELTRKLIQFLDHKMSFKKEQISKTGRSRYSVQAYQELILPLYNQYWKPAQ